MGNIIKVFNVANVLSLENTDALQSAVEPTAGIRSPRLVKALFYYTSSSGFSEMYLVVKVFKVVKVLNVPNVIRQKRKRAH